MTECSGGHIMGHLDNFSFEAAGKERPGIHTKIANPDADNQGEVRAGFVIQVILCSTSFPK
jgi:hypothetical protein